MKTDEIQLVVLGCLLPWVTTYSMLLVCVVPDRVCLGGEQRWDGLLRLLNHCGLSGISPGEWNSMYNIFNVQHCELNVCTANEKSSTTFTCLWKLSCMCLFSLVCYVRHRYKLWSSVLQHKMSTCHGTSAALVLHQLSKRSKLLFPIRLFCCCSFIVANVPP